MRKEEQQQVFEGWLRDHQRLFFKVVPARWNRCAWLWTRIAVNLGTKIREDE